MTTNQINFAKLKEEQRHNEVIEGQGYSSIAESRRHNQAQESIGWYTGASTVALNQARARYEDTQTDNFWFTMLSNSKNPEALLAYLIAEGIVSAAEANGWIKVPTVDNDLSESGDLYSNPNQHQK